MKWIDDQEDYFLRDFNAGKDNATGNADNANTATGGAPATPGTPDAQSNTGASDVRDTPGTGGQSETSTGEFTFPSSSGSHNSTPGNPGYGNNTTGGYVNSPTGSYAADNSKAQRRRRRRRRLAWFFLIIFTIAAVAFYIRYFVPYASDTVTTGYITLAEKRGIFFKTFEGEMISESMLADTAKIYSRDVFFSIPDDSLGRVVQSYQGTGKRVTITTQRYFGTLPWRGSQKSVITDIRPAN